MKKITLGSKILLGLIYFVFGLNGFLNFLPMPKDMPEKAMEFGSAMAATGYFFPFIKGTEVIFGLLLLIGLASPLALIILAPITINIFLFHFFLTPGVSNLVLPIVMIVIHLIAAKEYSKKYQALFSSK